MSDQNSFLQWKIRKGMFGWDHEYAALIDEAHDRGVDSGTSELSRLQSELTAAKAEVERLWGRESELESVLGKAWSSHCLEAVDWVDQAKETLSRSESAPWLLRKQAEAVESLIDRHSIKSISGEFIWTEAAEAEVRNLRQQADEIEKAGGGDE